MVLIGLAILTSIFLVGEKQGWARMGGFHQGDLVRLIEGTAPITAR
jgi:hypothetical protein